MLTFTTFSLRDSTSTPIDPYADNLCLTHDFYETCKFHFFRGSSIFILSFLLLTFYFSIGIAPFKFSIFNNFSSILILSSSLSTSLPIFPLFGPAPNCLTRSCSWIPSVSDGFMSRTVRFWLPSSVIFIFSAGSNIRLIITDSDNFAS